MSDARHTGELTDDDLQQIASEEASSRPASAVRLADLLAEETDQNTHGATHEY